MNKNFFFWILSVIINMNMSCVSNNDGSNSAAQVMIQNTTQSPGNIFHRNVSVNGVKIFYREAGTVDKPSVLLLHGFPGSSFMFRNLIPLLAKNYHVIAPDYPGFGFSDFPDTSLFDYSFENLSITIERFVDAIGLQKFSMYIQDYGSPIGLRLINRRPGLLSCLIVQNGNAYEEGLGKPWDPIKAFWKDPQLKENRHNILEFFTLESTRFQYEVGVGDKQRVSPESYTLDQALLDRPGNRDMQLSLMYDYRNNVREYPKWQNCLRNLQPPTLVVWGENDPFFIKEGALAYSRDIRIVEYHFYPTGHFALEEYNEDIAFRIDDFLYRNLPKTF